MTTKEEILKLTSELLQASDPPIMKLAAIGLLLDRYALSLVEQSLPEERDELHAEPTVSDINHGFNVCRKQTQINALRIVGGGEIEEKG